MTDVNDGSVQMTPAELAGACEEQLKQAQAMAGQILAPVQLHALAGVGLTIVPVRLLVKTLRGAG